MEDAQSVTAFGGWFRVVFFPGVVIAKSEATTFKRLDLFHWLTMEINRLVHLTILSGVTGYDDEILFGLIDILCSLYQTRI